MKKFIITVLIVAMVFSLAACGKKDKEESEANNEPAISVTTVENAEGSQNSDNNSGKSDDGKVTDEAKLGESITFVENGEDNPYFLIKTSAKIDNSHDLWFCICSPGIYLTRDSLTDSAYDERCFMEEYDKEWFDGVYACRLLRDNIAGIASSGVPTDYSIVWYEGETGTVFGQWLMITDGAGKYHFEFKDSWLKGAGEDKEVKEFDSLQDEVASWFSFNAYSEDWAEFFFDGFYLEQTDPQGYDKYYMMICPEGNYSTYEDADAVDYTYSDIAEKCPYKFSLENYCVPDLGKYTFVLAKMGGNVEVQFDAEKVNATDWKMDFSNAKCPALEGKYGDTAASSETSENVAESEAVTGGGEWTSTKFPKPENCTIVGTTDSFDGPVILVEWADKDAFLAYVDVLVGMGEGSTEDNLSEMDGGAAVYNSYNIHVAYSESDSALNNILIY